MTSMLSEDMERAPAEGDPPSMYDIGIDEVRPVTQKDIDRLLDEVHIMAAYRRGISLLEQMCHDALVGELPRRQFLDIVGSLAHGYTSKAAQQRQKDEAAGRSIRHQLDRAFNA